jgi:hypothetical protein
MRRTLFTSLQHATRLAAMPLLFSTFLCAACPAQAVEWGPQGIVRQFCRADGLGERVKVQGWLAVAPLVEWSFEPAWDHVVLVTGYEVGSPRSSENGAFAVDVRYTVVAQLSALGLDADMHVETVTLRLHAPDNGWRIIGPPPPPHLFANRVDVSEVRRSFEEGGIDFLANSTFVWRMFRTAGWNVDFKRTTDLLDGTVYRVVDTPKVGDVVAYLRDGQPYHVALLEAENQVVSSTLNAGVMRTATAAFPGEVKYLRLVQPEAPPTAEVQAAVVPPPAAPPMLRARRTPSPAVRKQKTAPEKPKTILMQPSSTPRVGHDVRRRSKRRQAAPAATPSR